jgi:hypothetical protein
MGFEPMNTGFADQRVSHFAIGACTPCTQNPARTAIVAEVYCGCGVVRRYGFTVL